MKKKLIGLLASTGIIFSFFAAGSIGGAKAALAGTSFDSTGSGTQSDPWVISTREQWNDLAAKVNDTNPVNLNGKYIALGSNLDVGSVTIGSANPFKGNFDGAGHTINIALTDVDTGYVGVFGKVDNGASVKNLTVAGSLKIKAGNDCSSFGAIAGTNNGVIDNCVNKVAMEAKNTEASSLGGIVGTNNGTISNCETAGSFAINTGFNAAGGICGYNTGIVRASTNTAPYQTDLVITDSTECGGIVGLNAAAGKVFNCTNQQRITADANSTNIGGITGVNHGEVFNCANDGIITTSGRCCGGIIGYNDSKLYNSYNKRQLSTSGTNNGTIFGYNSGNIINVVNYSTISLTGSNSECGIIGGWNDTDGTFVNTFDASTAKSIAIIGKNDGSSYPEKMNRTQVKNSHSVLYTADDTVQNGKALIDILNDFIDAPENIVLASLFNHWTVQNFDSEPLPTPNLYKVNIAPCENGSVVIAANYCIPGKVFKVKCIEDDGYAVEELNFDNNGDVTDVSNKREILMPEHEITIHATFVYAHVCVGVKHSGKAPGCFVDGYMDYYECSCGKCYSSENCNGETLIGSTPEELADWKKKNGKISGISHFANPVEGKAATKSEDGYKSCYVCKNCGIYLEDQVGEQEIGDAAAYEEWKVTSGRIAKLSVFGNGSLSIGAIIGISVGGVVGVLVITYVILLIVYKETGKVPGFLKGLFPSSKKDEE